MADGDPRARRAALAIHALNAEDGHRVLAMLDARQRERVLPVLKELRALGIPGPSTPPTTIKRKENQAPVDAVALLDAATVAQPLAKCSARTVAAILHVAQWPWADDACALLPAQLRLSARSQAQQVAKPAPEFANALCSALLDAARLRRAAAVAMPAPDRSGLLARMVRWRP